MTTVQEMRTMVALERLPRIMEELSKRAESISMNLALIAGELKRMNDDREGRQPGEGR